MKKIQTKYVTLLFLFVLSFSFAQEKDELGTEVVNIVKPYSPTISDAFKIKEVPVLNDSTQSPKKEVQYNIFSVPVASTFTPAKGKATAVEKAKPVRLYDNYAALGVGNYLNVLAEFYSNFEFSRTDNFGLYLKHNSSQGGIDEVVLDDKFYNTSLQGNFTSRQRDMSYEINGGIEHQLYNWYGLPSFYTDLNNDEIDAIDSKHSYFGGFVGGSISLEDSYFEDASAIIRYLSDYFSSSEFNIAFQPNFAFPVMDYQIEVGVDIDYLGGSFDTNYQGTSDIAYSIFNAGIAPSFIYQTDDLALSVGLSAYLSLDSENSTTDINIYPNILASYRLLEDQAIVFGGVDGRLHQNSYQLFKDENPYVSPTLYIIPTNEIYNGFAGIKGKISTFGYSLQASYRQENDKPLYRLNPAESILIINDDIQGYEFGNSFGIVYDDVSTLAVSGEVNFETSENFSVGLKGSFYNYDTDNQEEAWNLPTIEASLFSDFNITEKWYGGLSLFYVGERKDIQYSPLFPTQLPVQLTLDAYVDANIYTGYKFTKQLSFFIKGNNLFGENYQKWANYPVQGIQVLGGATYKFDW